jgi:hypothetical protein
MNKKESPFFWAPSIGLLIGNLGGKGNDDEHSGLVAPFGIDLALMLGLTIGVFKKVGFTFTPGVAVGNMGFIVLGVGIHFNRKWGIGLVVPVFPLWGTIW